MPPVKYEHIDFKPPASVADAARAALQLRASQPASKRGGTAVGVARARQLANRQNVSPSTARRMKAYFDRHEVDKKATGFKRGEKGFPSRGKQAWELWGGNAGYGWAKKLVRQMNAADEKAKAERELKITNKANEMASVRIYDPIGTGDGELSAKAFKIALDDLGEPKAITIHVNSQGGSVIEGIAIAGMIERHPAKVTALIEGGALSIASYIVMKADRVVMSNDAWLMIHNPMTAMQGDSVEFKKAANMMDRMASQLVDAYERRTGIDRDKIHQMMDDETWMTADEAIALGFVDEKTEPIETVQSLDVQAFRNVPLVVANAGFRLNVSTMKESKMPKATIKEIKAACRGCDAEFVLEQLEAEATIGEALASFSQVVNKTNAELKEEVESLKATIEAMEEEHKAMQEEYAAMEEEKENAEPLPDDEEEEVEEVEEEEEVEAMEEEEKKAVVNRSTQKPIRRAKQRGVKSATAEWQQAVADARQLPHINSDVDAVKYANKQDKTLRERMLAECQVR